MQGQRRERAKRKRDQLRRRAEDAGRDTYIDSNAPIGRYFNATRTLLSQARVYRAEGNAPDAYILYWRGATFYIERVAKHVRYNDASVRGMKQACALDVKNAMSTLEELDRELVMLFEMEEESTAAMSAAAASAGSGGTPPQYTAPTTAPQPPSAPRAVASATPSTTHPAGLLPEVQAAMAAFTATDAGHAGGAYPTLAMPASARPPPSAPPMPQPSALTAHSSALPAQPPALPPQPPDPPHMSPSAAVHRESSSSRAHRGRAAQHWAGPGATAAYGSPPVMVPPVVPPVVRPVPPAPPPPHSADATAPHAVAIPPLVPPTAPLPPPAAYCMPTAPPPPHCSVSCNCGTAPLIQPVSAPSLGDASSAQRGGELRRLLLPSNLTARFLEVARPNTLSNVETCGILAGRLLRDELHITHLLVPSQTGSSDQCGTTDEGEEDACMYHVENDLITLGWIHTHPSQMCFFSSVDLHTQCGYQSMLDEAIGIVLSPKSSPSTGVFQLTRPQGLKEVQQCTEKGFHPYHQRNGPNAGNGVYSECEHVITTASVSVQVVDLRK